MCEKTKFFSKLSISGFGEDFLPSLTYLNIFDLTNKAKFSIDNLEFTVMTTAGERGWKKKNYDLS